MTALVAPRAWPVILLDHIVFGEIYRLSVVAVRIQAGKRHSGFGKGVHQEVAIATARQEQPLATGVVVACAVWEMEGLTAREAGGTTTRKHDPWHRRRLGQVALPRRRAPRAADGREDGSVSARPEVEEHQAKEL